MLTLGGFVVPMLGVFLALAYYDEKTGRRGVVPASTGPPAPPPASATGARGESALLSVRIQQWIVNDSDSMHSANNKDVIDDRGEFRVPR